MNKKVLSSLVATMLVSSSLYAGDEAIKGGTIPGVASVGVDLLADKSAWKSVKEHLSNNWGKYTLGIVTAAVGAMVYNNNNGFKSDKGSSSSVTTSLHDESMPVSVSGNYNTINIFSNRDSDNGK
jgi:hypothetical protein